MKKWFIGYKIQGFSLIELLILLTVASLAGIFLVSIFVQNNGLFIQQSIKVSNGLSANDAVSVISEDIRQASSVAAGYSLSNPVYTTSPNTLVLSFPSIDASGNTISNTFDYMVISADASTPNVLRERLFKDAQSFRKDVNRVLTNQLSLIRFYYLDSSGNIVTPSSATTVNFVINVSGSSGLKTETSSSSGQVNLRNN